MKPLIWMLCALLVAPLSGTGLAAPQGTARDPGLMADYARQLPIGSRVRADLIDGRHVRGTLMNVADDHVVISRRTRLPEPPVEVPFSTVRRLELETSSSNVVKTVAIGVASGVAGALGVFAILAAIFAD